MKQAKGGVLADMDNLIALADKKLLGRDGGEKGKKGVLKKPASVKNRKLGLGEEFGDDRTGCPRDKQKALIHTYTSHINDVSKIIFIVECLHRIS